MQTLKTLLTLFLVGIYSSGTGQDILWNEIYGGNNNDKPLSIEKVEGLIISGFLITGYSYSTQGPDPWVGNYGKNDGWIIEFDGDSEPLGICHMGGSFYDAIYDVIKISRRQIITVGFTRSTDEDIDFKTGNDADYWLAKVNNWGGIEQDKILDKEGVDIAKSIVQINDEEFLTAGVAESSDDDDDIWVVKFDDLLSVDWKRNYGGRFNEQFNAMTKTKDGGVIILGNSYSDDRDVSGNNGKLDIWVIKLNEKGEIEWEENYGGSKSDKGKDIIQTSDGGFMVVGYSESSDGDVNGNLGADDFWVLKIDAQGNIEWEENYGGGGNDRASAVLEGKNGNYLVGGGSHSSDGHVNNDDGNHGQWDIWLVKLSRTGQLRWEQNYGGSDNEGLQDMVLDDDGNYMVAGYSKSKDGDIFRSEGGHDYWVLNIEKSPSAGLDRKYGVESELQLKPVPARTKLTWQLDARERPQSYAIQSLTGKQVKAGKLDGNARHTVEVKGLSPGVYVLEVMTNEAVRTKKVVIE